MDDMFIRRDFGEELKPGTVLRVWVGATRQQHVSSRQKIDR